METLSTQALYDAIVAGIVSGTSATSYPMREASDISDVLNQPKPGITDSFSVSISESNARDMDAVDGFYTSDLRILVTLVWPVKRRTQEDTASLYVRQPILRSSVQQRFNAGQGATGGLLCKVWWVRNTEPQRVTPDYWMIQMEFAGQIEQER